MSCMFPKSEIGRVHVLGSMSPNAISKTPSDFPGYYKYLIIDVIYEISVSLTHVLMSSFLTQIDAGLTAKTYGRRKPFRTSSAAASRMSAHRHISVSGRKTRK